MLTTTNSDSLVLVIEDDVDIRETIQEALESEGYSVLTAPHGLEALSIIKSAPTKPKLILLDLNMPIMNGYEFLEHKSKDTSLSEIPVIVFSANLNPLNPKSAVAYLKKPTDLNIILDMVKKYYA